MKISWARFLNDFAKMRFFQFYFCWLEGSGRGLRASFGLVILVFVQGRPVKRGQIGNARPLLAYYTGFSVGTVSQGGQIENSSFFSALLHWF